jgi:hypothetical protein
MLPENPQPLPAISPKHPTPTPTKPTSKTHDILSTMSLSSLLYYVLIGEGQLCP